MFEETIRNLEESRADFNEHVRDSFGKSIDEEAYAPVKKELQVMEAVATRAAVQKGEIAALTLELETIW